MPSPFFNNRLKIEHITVTTRSITGGIMKKNVYVTGYYFDKDKGSIPCYWINGTKLILPIDGYDGTVNNIYVDNLDVYISGDYVNDGSMACYWKNGIRTDLNTKNSETSSIYVSGSDVYVAGSYDTDCAPIACYWKNGTKIDLSKKHKDFAVYTTGIKIVDQDIYVSGYYEKGFLKSTACYWKNGVRTDLEKSNSCTNSIFVSGSDVYITGYYNNGKDDIACYWKNGVRVELSQKESSAYSIFVNGSDVYVVGYYVNKNDISISCIWKNGEIIRKFNSDFTAETIYIDGNDIYLAGHSIDGPHNKGYACYWKNKTKYQLTNYVVGFAEDIIVK